MGEMVFFDADSDRMIEVICMDNKMKAMKDSIWLKYFTRYLFEHGAITEEERNRLIFKINNRYRTQKNANS